MLFSSILAIALAAFSSQAQVISKVEWIGADLIDREELSSASLLSRGAILTQNLMRLELARIDSIYFSHGFLAVEMEVDIVPSNDAVAVRLILFEGKKASIGEVTITGGSVSEKEEMIKRLGIEEETEFDPRKLGLSMKEFLDRQVDSGYPFAQVWLTGFSFDDSTNSVDLVISQYRGDRSTISNIIFEGIARTDSSFALRISRLERGDRFREKDLEMCSDYLARSGIFRSIGQVRVIMRDAGKVDLVVPVVEKKNNNSFLGAFGFYQEDTGDYRLNGSLNLDLRNIAGKGRDINLDWLNDGQKYSNTRLVFREPFFLSMPFHLDGELRQTVKDTLYDMASGGASFRIPVGPVYSITTGIAAERTLFGTQSRVERNSKQRYRLGLIRDRGAGLRFDVYLEGARRSSRYTDGRREIEKQLLYRFEGSIEFDVRRGQSFYSRLTTEGIFFTGDISISEMFLLGGARSLRGYRENQFRGEKTGCLNLEYRFGEESRLFFFNDTGAYYRAGQGWEVKNGSGFGVVSASQFGIVELSFGVGDELSLSSTRIHISLTEKF
ncbi:MAG: hypothetical protein JW746_08925 [Candidatus Krumholzibacteriota bacterium]|nr:hypothetical protein [Candidatus Krumholzibacteriota bacterium]